MNWGPDAPEPAPENCYPEPPLSKEAIYDALVAPHMSAIIAICQSAGIPIFACYQLTTEAEAAALGRTPLYCTTLTQPEGVNTTVWRRFYEALFPKAGLFRATVLRRPGAPD